MKSISVLKKSLALFTALGVMVAFANTYVDRDIFSSKFMDQKLPSIVDNYDIEDEVRDVASAERELPAAQYLPANKVNRALIDRKWEITRIINEKKEVVFDVFNKKEDKNKLLVLEFEMVGTSQVRIDGNDNFIFDISLLHEKGRSIVLFRTFGDGYEIVEARKRSLKTWFTRVKKNIFTKDKTIEVKKDNVIEKNKGIFMKHLGESLILERAIVPTINHGVFKEAQVNGELVLSEASIESLSASIAVGTDKEFSLPNLDYVKVNDGGQFSFEGEDGNVVSGVITNNGQDGYRVRIATGPHAGTMLNFVTSEEYERIQIKDREQKAREIKIREERESSQVSFTSFLKNKPSRLPASK